MCDAVQEPLPLVSVTVPEVVCPSPQAYAQVCVSRTPTSVKLTLIVALAPVLTVVIGPVTVVMTGATLFTVTLVEPTPTALNVSNTLAVIVKEGAPVGSSLYLWDAAKFEEVALTLTVVGAVPSPQSRLTVWLCPASGSVNVPVRLTVPPSLIVVWSRVKPVTAGGVSKKTTMSPLQIGC